tara:strand:- start:208 stop:1215 length:1008 start_codon:yes stop_codon:yes gene_type:complete
MKIIKVSSGIPEYTKLLLRQSPQMKGIWNDCKFIVNSNVKECDWWFVLHGSGLVKSEECFCDPSHIVYVSMEPTEIISKVSKKFLDQFSHLIICDRNINHPNITYMNWLTWWVGIIVNKTKKGHIFESSHIVDYDKLTDMKPMKKINKLSIVLSNKDFSNGHKKRIKFLDKLMNSDIADSVDVYGHGFNPIPDKWDAIVKYKYHLVLENSLLDDYWSEKLADAFLGFSLPIYYGCPNISDYFSQKSLFKIDIDQIDKSIDSIQEILESNLYDERLESIRLSRHKVLNDYNIFNLMASMSSDKASELKKIKLQTNYFFSDSWLKKIARYFLSMMGI